MKTAAHFFATLALIAATATAAKPAPNIDVATAGLGETVRVESVRVTPVMLLEDSRCPARVTCVWAGQVRIAVRISLGKALQVRELTLGKPVEIGGGTLELVEVHPLRTAEAAIPDRDYRFGFRYSGSV